MTLLIAAFPDCPVAARSQLLRRRSDRAAPTARSTKTDFYDRVLLHDFAPDIVVVVDIRATTTRCASHDMIAGARQTHTAPATPTLRSRPHRARHGTSLAAIRAPGRKVVILEPIPAAPIRFDPISCISSGKPLERVHLQRRRSRRRRSRASTARQANGTTVFSIDPDRFACPSLPVCDAVVDGMIVKRDPSHLTGTYSRYLAPQLLVLLVAAGVFRSP